MSNSEAIKKMIDYGHLNIKINKSKHSREEKDIIIRELTFSGYVLKQDTSTHMVFEKEAI